MTHNNALLTTLLALALSLLGAGSAHAQFADCSTGLLQMPMAEMKEDGTLNKHSLATSMETTIPFYIALVRLWGERDETHVC